MTSSASPSIPTPPPEDPPPSSFDIVSHYHHLLATDPLLTQSIAAIESLISLLSASPPSTISETLSLLASSTATLKASTSNPIPLSAGTDLFQRYIISTLQPGGSTSSTGGGAEDFQAVREHLLANSRLFVQRAREARGRIAAVARNFIRDGSTVLTCGSLRVVATVLNAAADRGTTFRVIYIEDSQRFKDSRSRATDVIRDLRQRGVPVATIPFAALATALSSATFAMVGAESVVANGGVISSTGTYQIGLLMQSVGKPFYVVAESHTFVRMYPLTYKDLPNGQGGLDFRTDDVTEDGEGKAEHEEGRRKADDDGVDLTPPELITAFVTEAGVQSPSAISEELIKIWY
ncbi:translation initiation factor eIF-2B subunit alpha [Lecanora helva]